MCFKVCSNKDESLLSCCADALPTHNQNIIKTVTNLTFVFEPSNVPCDSSVCKLSPGLFYSPGGGQGGEGAFVVALSLFVFVCWFVCLLACFNIVN